MFYPVCVLPFSVGGSYSALEELRDQRIQSVVVGPKHLAFLVHSGEVCRIGYKLLDTKHSCEPFKARSDKAAGARSSHPSGPEDGGAKVARSAAPRADSRSHRSRAMSAGKVMEIRYFPYRAPFLLPFDSRYTL